MKLRRSHCARQQKGSFIMSANRRASRETYRLTGTAILAAVVVVLTVVCTFVRFGPFSITLALAPILIGSALYGSRSGAILGFTFGLVVLITGLFGWDGGTVMYLMSQNAFALLLIVLLKGTAAGWLAGVCYHALHKKNEKMAVVISGIVCPVVNTGLFILGMLIAFIDTLNSWASDSANLISYLIIGLTGVNFLVELAVNLLLSAGITRLIRYGKKVE